MDFNSSNWLTNKITKDLFAVGYMYCARSAFASNTKLIIMIIFLHFPLVPTRFIITFFLILLYFARCRYWNAIEIEFALNRWLPIASYTPLKAIVKRAKKYSIRALFFYQFFSKANRKDVQLRLQRIKLKTKNVVFGVSVQNNRLLIFFFLLYCTII